MDSLIEQDLLRMKWQTGNNWPVTRPRRLDLEPWTPKIQALVLFKERKKEHKGWMIIAFHTCQWPGNEESLICVTHWQGVQRTPQEKKHSHQHCRNNPRPWRFPLLSPFHIWPIFWNSCKNSNNCPVCPMWLTKTQFLQRWDGLRSNTTVIRRSLGHLPMEENPF